MKILVVDDSKLTRNMLALPLTRAGFEVLSAPDPHEAIGMLAESKPDLVITDLRMPNLNDGLGLLKMIALEDDDLPVVVYSAESGADEALGEVGLQRLTFLKKPVSANDLVRRVRAILQ